MNMLTNHELNDLQASYWDKILPYLEEAVLETALLARYYHKSTKVF